MPVQGDLARERAKIISIARKHGASNVRVFGSVARGTERPDSDVDLLVRAETSTMFDLAAMEEEIERLLGRKVQVVSESGLKPRVRDVILREAVEV